jgi:hypothetical protein
LKELEKQSLENRLLESINQGLDAEQLSKFILPILERQRDELILAIEDTDFNYQNLDNNYLYMLQFEMKALKKVRLAFERAISDGQEAKNRLNEINSPAPVDHSAKRKFKF